MRALLTHNAPCAHSNTPFDALTNGILSQTAVRYKCSYIHILYRLRPFDILVYYVIYQL